MDWRTAEGAELKLSDTPLASLELKVKNRANFDKLDGFSDKDSPDYIADEKARAETVKKFKADNLEFVDDMRRIEAIEKGTNEVPIDDKLVNAHVGYGKLIDQESIGSSSAEVMLYRVDNADYDAFRTDTAIWDNQALTPLDRSRIPIWRIDVKYRKEDAEYNAIKNPLPVEQVRLRAEYMATHEAYRKDDRRREAYKLTNSKTGEKFPDAQVENYIGYYELSEKGQERERFLVMNGGKNPDNLTGFAKAMHEIAGLDIPRPEDVPDVQYDLIYKQYKEEFDKLAGFSDFSSPHYIASVAARDKAVNVLRFDANGKYSEFGLAELRRNAYGLKVPQEQIGNYVEYYRIQGEGKPENYPENLAYWEDDWFLIENKPFWESLKAIMRKDNPEWGKEKEASWKKVPTREIGAKYITYLKLTNQAAKDQYRLDNPDLDKWGVSVGIWSATMAEKRRKLGLTPTERFKESLEEGLEEFGKRLK